MISVDLKPFVELPTIIKNSEKPDSNDFTKINLTININHISLVRSDIQNPELSIIHLGNTTIIVEMPYNTLKEKLKMNVNV